MDRATVNRNLLKLQAVRCMATGFVLFPVYAVFYQEKGLSWTEIFLLEAFYCLVASVLEIPSGWFADHFGHKKSIVVSCVMITMAFGLYYIGEGFFWLLAAELLIGVSYGFRSGADSALAIESLKTIGEEERNLAFETDSQIYANIGGVVSSVAGGFAASLWGLDAVVIIQASVALCSVILACMLREAPRAGINNDGEPTEPGRRKLGDMKRAVIYAFSGEPRFKWYMGASALISGSLSVGYWLMQPYYQATGIPLGLFGILGACYLGLVSLFAFLFRFFQHISPEVIVAVCVVVLVVTFALVGAGMTAWMLPALLGFCFVSAVASPTMINQINQAVTDSTIRATVLSVRALSIRLAVMLTPAVGRVVDTFSLQAALLGMAAVGAVCGVPLIVGLLRNAKAVAAP